MTFHTRDCAAMEEEADTSSSPEKPPSKEEARQKPTTPQKPATATTQPAVDMDASEADAPKRSQTSTAPPASSGSSAAAAVPQYQRPRSQSQVQPQSRPQQGVPSRTLQSHSLGPGGVPLAALAAAAELLVLQGELDESARSGWAGGEANSSDRPVKFTGARAPSGESPDAATLRPSRKSTEEVAHAVLMHSQRPTVLTAAPITQSVSSTSAASNSVVPIPVPNLPIAAGVAMVGPAARGVLGAPFLSSQPPTSASASPVNVTSSTELSSPLSESHGPPNGIAAALSVASAVHIKADAQVAHGRSLSSASTGSDVAQLPSVLGGAYDSGSGSSTAARADTPPPPHVGSAEGGHLVALLPGRTQGSALRGMR